MPCLYLDYESYYDTDYSLRKMTTVEYVMDPRWETLGAAVALDDEPSRWIEGPDLPALYDRIDWGRTVLVSHNTMFDGAVLAFRHGRVPALYCDTLSMARATLQHKLKSLSLEKLSEHLGLQAKMKTITQMKGVRLAQLRSNPALYAEFKQYAGVDNDNCREAFKVLKRGFPRDELAIIDMLMRMYCTPQLQVDAGKLNVHLQKVRQEKQALLDRLGFDDKATLMSNEKFAQELISRGVDPPRKISATTGKETWAFSKNDPGFKLLADHHDPDVQALAAARLGHKSTLEETRTEKLIRIGMLYPKWPDRAPWLPVPLRYSGAHTHRLSGSDGYNMQNLSRGGTLRKSIVPPPGHQIVTADLSQIEARIVCWLAGAKMLDVFARGEDPYAYQAIQIGAMPAGLPKDDPVFKKGRQLGKALVLGCIGEGTEVLTDRGYVEIQNVGIRDRVWDGFGWVTHLGLLDKGFRETLEVSGVRLTPDHLVLCGGRWTQAGDMVSDGRALSQALATGSANLPSSATLSRKPAGGLLLASSSAAAALLNTSLLSTLSGVARRFAATLAPESSRTPHVKPTGATLTSSLLKMRTYDLASAGPRNRFTVRTPDGGHLVVHNCGFGLGPPTFQATVARPPYNMPMSLDEAQKAVYGYRNTNPEIVRLWKILGDALQRLALRGNARLAERVDVVRGLAYETDGYTVRLELPSGLHLKYENLRLEADQMWFDYAGQRQYVYGGKATENLVQALARCVIMEAALRVKRQFNRWPALQVHDENVYVIPDPEVDEFKAALAAAMTARPTWAPDLPVQTEVGSGPNYGESK